MAIHCLKCKRRTDDKDSHTVTSSNGRRMEVAHCVECDTKKNKFLPKLSTNV
jgi:hypothetical protein